MTEEDSVETTCIQNTVTHIWTITDAAGRTETYTRDVAGRMGNRTTVTVKDSKQRLVEQRDYTYNESNQLVTEMSCVNCKRYV